MYTRFCLPGEKCAAAVRWPICTTGCCSQCQQIHIWPDAQSAPWWTAKNRHKNRHQTKSPLMNNMSVLTNARAKNHQSPEWHNHYYFLQSKQSFSRLKLLFNFASSQTSDFKISVSMEIHESLTKKQLVLRYSFVHFSLFKNDPCCSSSDWILSTDKNNLMSEFCRLNECLLWSFLLLEFDLQIMLLFTTCCFSPILMGWEWGMGGDRPQTWKMMRKRFFCWLVAVSNLSSMRSIISSVGTSSSEKISIPSASCPRDNRRTISTCNSSTKTAWLSFVPTPIPGTTFVFINNIVFWPTSYCQHFIPSARSHKHNINDLSHLHYLSHSMHVNTRYINSTIIVHQ